MRVSLEPPTKVSARVAGTRVEIDAQTGRLGRVNAAFCELLGYSEVELRELSYTGPRYTELLHPDERGHLEALGLEAQPPNSAAGSWTSSPSLRKEVPREVHLLAVKQQVLERMALGTTNDVIGRGLELMSRTVCNYITTVYNKLGVHSRAEAIVWARERGIVG